MIKSINVTIKAIVYNNSKNEIIDRFTVIKDDRRMNFDNLRKYCSDSCQYEDIKYTIDLLNDYGFNYFKNGICTKGIYVFTSYDFAELKYIIEFREFQGS